MLKDNPTLFGLPKYLIMDPIHGGIEIFTHERRIIDHPLFLRLRHIKQTDILHYVFPSATHSRFEHCLGTMFVSSKIFKNMMKNYMTEGNKYSLSNEDIDSIQYLFGCLRIASLLHDVGHLPFSHQFEESTFGKQILKDKSILSTLWKNIPSNIIKSTPSELHHEDLSIRCAIKIFDDLNKNKTFPYNATDIIGIMENGDSDPSNKFIKSSLNIVKLLVKNHSVIESLEEKLIALKVRKLFKDIISSEVDADKMDYLLRDSYFSGCKYGIYNLDHLTQNLCAGFDLSNDFNEAWFGIALKNKGLGALEDFVFSRFRMYLQLYNHKTVVGFKWLLHKAISEVMEDEDNIKTFKAMLSNIDDFKNLTDTFFWEAFRKYANSHKFSACFDLVNRIKLDHIISHEDMADFEKNKEKTRLEKHFSKGVIYHEASSKFSKVKPKYDQLRILYKDKITTKRELKSISKASRFFDKFNDTIVTHFFITPEFNFDDN